MRCLMLFCLLLLSACAPQEVAVVVTPTPSLSGSVTFLFPSAGTIYYSETLTLNGQADGIGNDGFEVRVTHDILGVLATSRVYPLGQAWQVALPVVYDGEPVTVTIQALQPRTGTLYNETVAILSARSYRQEGAYASFFSHSDGDTLGGEQVAVSGTASLLPDTPLFVILVAADGATIYREEAQLIAFNALDEVPFMLEIPLTAYKGNATLRLSILDATTQTEVILDELSVVVGAIAG